MQSQNNKNLKLALTIGDPAGIGPEICVKALQNNFQNTEIILIGDQNVLVQRMNDLQMQINLPNYDPNLAQSISIINVPSNAKVKLGEPDVNNAKTILATLKIASELAIKGEVDILTTAPVAKHVIANADANFIGHTEYLAQAAKVQNPVMVLMNEKLIVALATTHLAIKDIAQAITKDKVLQIINTCNSYLPKYLAKNDLTIKVCGLNPHAGEAGKIGDEEITNIIPAIKLAQENKINVSGPHSADTIFLSNENQTTCIIAMYHDQALPVIKTLDFAHTINLTLGLPYIRTSVDHGTAFDIAPKLTADPSSLITAINRAIKFKQNLDAKKI